MRKRFARSDIIRNIRTHFQYIRHFHTAGNPGRHQFDETQELQYDAIAKAIVDLGYTGYLSHEYSPSTPDPLKSLDEMMRICDEVPGQFLDHRFDAHASRPARQFPYPLLEPVHRFGRNPPPRFPTHREAEARKLPLS